MGCCGSKCHYVSSKSKSIDSFVSHNSSSNAQQIINRYILEDCSIRHKHGSNINEEKQLRIQRIEIICMGCFLYKNRSAIRNGNVEILVRDKTINNTKVRPDLIFKRNERIFHVEIDENSHSGYDKEKEINRYEIIKDYCQDKYNSYTLIRFNPNVYGKLDTVDMKLNIATQFNNLLNNIDGLIAFEKQK